MTPIQRLQADPWHGLFALGLAALLGLTAWLYWPGLSGPLLLDDLVNLQALGQGGGVHNLESLQRFVLGNGSGPLGRPLSMLSFLLDAQDWPPRVASLKYTNVMIHLLCGTGICWLTWLLLQALETPPRRAAGIALACTALWLLHPIQVSTTLYVIQRMTQLMTLFGLAALILYCRGRLALRHGRQRGLIYLVLSLMPCALLSLLSKESGVLVLLAIVILESTLFASYRRDAWVRRWYRYAVLLPLLLAGAYFAFTFYTRLADFSHRPFGPMERLLTEARVLVIYLVGFLLPPLQRFGLYHDDLQLSTGLFSPWTTLPSVLVIAALLLGAGRERRRHPVFALGVFWFFGMHLLESTVLPLELYFEHRNYLALFGPMFALCWYLWRGLATLGAAQARVPAAAVSLLVVVSLSWLTWQETSLWGDTPRLFAVWAQEHPDSIRAQSSEADFRVAVSDFAGALEPLARAAKSHPDELSILLYQWNASCTAGLIPGYTLAQIAARDDLVNYVGNLNLHLQSLLENILRQACPAPDPADVIAVFDRAALLPQTRVRLANLHLLYSEYFVMQRNLDGALIQLRQAFESQPRPEFPLRQARLAASAGNYQDSLVFLERARQANAARPVTEVSQAEEIEALYAEILRLSGNAPTN